MNQTVNYVFDATQHDPSAGAPPAIPAGNYLLTITETAIENLKDDKGQCFVVKSVVEDGEYKGSTIRKQYNLWNNNSAKNSEIAHGELSALCHVTGVLKVDFNNAGAALKGGRYRARLTNDGTYNDVKEVFDVNGNKPGKVGSGFGAAKTAPVATATPNAAGWGTQPAAAPVSAPAAPAAPIATAPAAPVATAEQIAAQYGVQHYPGHRYDPATNAYVPDTAPAPTPPAAPASPFAGGTPAPAAPAAPAQPAWNQAAAPATPAAPWGQPTA